MEHLMRFVSLTGRYARVYREYEFKQLGLNAFEHFYILNICRNPGLSQDQIARRLYLNKSTVTRQLASLEEKGFVLRVVDENDKRVMRVYPTEKAIEIRPKIFELIRKWNDYVLNDFSEEEKTLLFPMLARIMERAGQYAEALVEEEEN